MAMYDENEEEIHALNARNRYLEKELGEAYKQIHELEVELEAARNYSRNEAARRQADDDFVWAQSSYEGQP